MGLSKSFSNSFQTADIETDKRLLTRYYHNNYDTVKEAILSIAKKHQFKIDGIDDRYKEIGISSKKEMYIFNLANPNYTITSVDIKIVCHFLLPFMRPAKMINEFYDELNKLLELNHVGGKNEQ
jgi:hypothetical protein